MKILSKINSLIIIIILMAAYVFPIISVASSEKYSNYVALGDSIAYGYALKDRDTESYAQKVRKNYNISNSNFQNLAVSGMTCAEFYKKIQETDYTNAIKKADLITVSIGSNELLSLVIKTVSEVTGIPQNDSNFVNKVQNLFLSASLMKKMQLLTSIYNKFTSEEMKQEIEKAINSYDVNWKNSVQYIKQINPNVQIVATEFYNPYYEIALGSYDLGGFVDENIQKLNKILISQSNSEKEYKIAKIYEAFNTTNPRLTNVNISTSNLNVDPHPNALGHDVICTKILDALSNTSTGQTKKDIASLTINELTDQIYTGKEITPAVVIKDGSTTLTQNKDYTVSYSQNIEIGEAKVTIIGIGNYSGKILKTFNIKEQERQDISKLKISDIKDQTYLGIKVTPTIEIKNGNTVLTQNKDYELSYEDNINVGTAKVTIRGIGNYESQIVKSFKIVPKDISLVTVLDIDNQKYTGEKLEPAFDITDGSAKLVKDKDYTINYKNNTEIGTATIEITGKGNYTGNITKNFNIVENVENNVKDISKLSIKNIEDKVYTGKLITPEVKISDGQNTLIKNKDYTINYYNNINVGTATAIIKGVGNYTGQIEMSFNIVKKDINYTTILDIPDYEYTGKEIKCPVTIESDNITLKEGKEYQIKYINNTNIGTATIEIIGIGNYTGKATKTFNIVQVKKQDDKNQENNNITNTNNNTENIPYNRLPFAGVSKILIAIFGIVTIIAISLYIWLKRYKGIIS